MGKQNMAMFERAMKMLIPFGGKEGEAPPRTDQAKPADDELTTLKTQLDQLQRQLDQLTRVNRSKS
jgi:polyhydroxyalkanoate synthesis regulator protein